MTEIAKLWRSTLGIAVIIWVLVGFLLSFMPAALALWILIGVAAAFGLFFAGERFRRWGVGD